jgi:starch synthase
MNIGPRLGARKTAAPTSLSRVRIGVLTREFPPEVYGGAGVHVEYLSAQLRHLADVEVHCFGQDRPGAHAYRAPAELTDANFALQTLGTDLAMAGGVEHCDLVHSHTWYANMAGHWAKLLHGIPHVATTHSLEPLRPWKAEQLGGGYELSLWAERTALEAADAVIAVSAGMRQDVLATYPQIPPERVHVIYNGIDTDEYAADPGADVLLRHGVDPARPYVIFVGRITRQKGLSHLLRAARALPAGVQLVLCAGAPDTAELSAEVTELVTELSRNRGDVVWIEQMLPRPDVIQLLSGATAFVCPSVYEPLGIVNLEAMACSTAVVASAVGGIPEVVLDGTTGQLVPAGDEEALAAAMTDLVSDPDRAARMGAAGRQRAVSEFSWRAIAEQTAALYRGLLG